MISTKPTYFNYRMARLESGFVYLWALFAVALAGVVMAGTGQVWQTKSQRDKEAELMFIGEEFRKAIMSYHNSNKQYPSSLEDLLKDERSPNIKRHLRKIYLDPITNTAEWGLVDEPPPTAGAAASKGSATDKSAAANKNSTTSGGLAPSNTQTTGTGQASSTSPTSSTNPAAGTSSTSTTGGPGQTASDSSAPASGTTPNASSGMSTSIGKKIIGVYSLSEKKPIKKDRFPEHFAKFSEALTYKDWQFVYKPGDAKKPGASGATPTKPGAAATNPFGSPSSSSSTPAKGASPFPSSSSGSDSKAPATGFSSGQ